jgi:CHAT domain-containing protein
MIDSKDIQVVKKEKSINLEKELTGFRNAIFYKIEDQYIRLSTILSQQLLPTKLPRSKQLVIILDGKLSTTPFEALFYSKIKKGRALPLLIQKASIQYNYSTTLYLESIQNSTNGCNAENILLCAPVSFDRMSNLPGSKKEVLDISQEFKNKGYHVTSFMEANATEDSIKTSTGKKWCFIHLATHGLINENNPELSKIVLQRSVHEDGNLFSGEIYNLNLNSELITLSACETGLGRISKGEGLMGLSRALLYAGGNNIIVSLWSVSDEATQKLMTELYKEILLNPQNSNFGEALQKAKKSLINSNSFNAPYYWAPFILIGH